MLTKIQIPSYIDFIKSKQMFDNSCQRFRAFISISHTISCQYPEYFENNSNSVFIIDIKKEFKRTLKC